VGVLVLEEEPVVVVLVVPHVMAVELEELGGCLLVVYVSYLPHPVEVYEQ
jgi:hypothetical protein